MKRRACSVVVFSVSMLVLSPVRAQDQPEYAAKSKLNYVKGNVTKHCPLDRRPDDLARCKQELTSAKKALDQIVPANRKLPLYSEVAGYLDKANAKVAGWDKGVADEKAAGADADRLRKEFSSDVDRFDRALLLLSKARSPKPDDVRFLKGKDVDAMIEQGESLAELAALCEGKYKGKQIPTFSNESRHDHPKNACDMAVNWKQHVGGLASQAAAARAQLVIANLDSGIDQIEAKAILYEKDLVAYRDPKAFIAKERAAFEPSFAKLGVEMPAELFAGIEPVAARYPDAVKKAAAENRWPKDSKHHDGAAEKAIAAAVTDAGFKVVKQGLIAPEWEIVKNDIDLPLRKLRTGTVAARAKGEDFCRLYQVTATAQYQGGGKYAKPIATFDHVQHGAIVTKCP